MSRQYDEYIDGLFEINGEEYRIVYPSNLKEMIKALETRDAIQYALDACLHDDENIGNYEQLLEEQQAEIDTFREDFPDYDNTLFLRNLNYLLKKHSLRTGDLEYLMKVSAGYISRTAKENAAKKLSIDVVWKIAAFFEVSLEKLLTEDLSMPDKNSDIIRKFVARLYKKTLSHDFEWKAVGGYVYEMSKEFESLVIPNNNESEHDGMSKYVPYDMNPNATFYLCDDIYSCRGIEPDRLLMVIPFSLNPDKNYTHYEFVFVSQNKDGSLNKEVIFNSAYECFAMNDSHCKELYELIKEMAQDAPLSKDMKSFMLNFISED